MKLLGNKLVDYICYSDLKRLRQKFLCSDECTTVHKKKKKTFHTNKQLH